MADATPSTTPGTPARRIFTATLIIGPTGSGKTSLFETFAQYLWETYGKVLFLNSWDGGAIPTGVQKAMKQGLIRFWRVRTRSAPGLGIETLYKATKGYVPKHINPETGETSPAVQMIAPVVSKYTCYCPKGHPLLEVPHAALITPTYCSNCKEMIPKESMRISEESRRTKGLELIGGVGFDGLTSMSSVVMDHMDHSRGAGDIGGEKPAFGGIVTSGDVKLGGNNRADVGFGQSRAQQFVNNSLSIPFLVEGPIFTALSAEASEEGLPIVGAKLPGRAATDEASSWFGNVLETGSIKDDSGLTHRALYIRPWYDSQNRRHLMKTSASPGGVPDMLIDPPEKDQRPFEQFNLGLYFKMLDDDLKKAVANQPVLAAPFADYGDAAAVETPAAASNAAPATTAGPVSQTGTPMAGAQASSGVAIPRPRSRGRAAAPAPPPTLTPSDQTPAAASPDTTQPPVTTTPSTTPAVVAGAPPPPPGARPPQRAPGT
jgi:energy-coupling factor transporter ATP-binding protein EcfA2